jgi:hypothetical protein
MTGLTNYLADQVLAYTVGKTAMNTLPTAYVALFTAVGTDTGTGFTEVSAGGYSRATTTGASWNAASGTAPATLTNALSLAFGTSTASWGNIIAFGLYDAVSSGNLLAWDFLGNDPWVPFSCTLASPGVLTAIGITANSAPVLANGAIVVLTNEYGGTLPTGLTQYTQYTVAGLSADTFNVGVNTSSTGDGLVRQITVQNIPIGIVPVTFPASSFTLSAA